MFTKINVHQICKIKQITKTPFHYTSTDSFKHQGILIKIYLTMFLAATVAVMPSKVGTDSAPQMLIYYPL